jgi:hypothetical protein
MSVLVGYRLNNLWEHKVSRFKYLIICVSVLGALAAAATAIHANFQGSGVFRLDLVAFHLEMNGVFLSANVFYLTPIHSCVFRSKSTFYAWPLGIWVKLSIETIIISLLTADIPVTDRI